MTIASQLLLNLANNPLSLINYDDDYEDSVEEITKFVPDKYVYGWFDPRQIGEQNGKN